MVRVFCHLECSVAGGLGDAAVRGDLEVGDVSGPTADALTTAIEHLELCIALRESHAGVVGYLKCPSGADDAGLIGCVDDLRVGPTGGI